MQDAGDWEARCTENTATRKQVEGICKIEEEWPVD